MTGDTVVLVDRIEERRTDTSSVATRAPYLYVSAQQDVPTRGSYMIEVNVVVPRQRVVALLALGGESRGYMVYWFGLGVIGRMA